MSSYGGVVMALTSLTVLLGHCAKGRREQFLSAQQLMLAAFCMLAGEALWPKSATSLLHSEAADFFAECKLVWGEVYGTHLSDPWLELAAKAKAKAK